MFADNQLIHEKLPKSCISRTYLSISHVSSVVNFVLFLLIDSFRLGSHCSCSSIIEGSMTESLFTLDP